MTTTKLLEVALAVAAVSAVAGHHGSGSTGNAEAGDPASSEPIDVGTYGAFGDGVFDNSAAFEALSAAVNRTPVPAGGRATVVFPPGRYRYSSGLSFAVPLRLVGPGAVLEYSGPGVAIRVRARASGHVDCVIDGLTFAGAAPAIAVDKAVSSP